MLIAHLYGPSSHAINIPCLQDGTVQDSTSIFKIITIKKNKKICISLDRLIKIERSPMSLNAFMREMLTALQGIQIQKIKFTSNHPLPQLSTYFQEKQNQEHIQ